MLRDFSRGDEVAILPQRNSPAEDVREIGKIAILSSHAVQLDDHRMYSRYHRWGLTARSKGYIVRATDEHRASIRRRTRGAQLLDAPMPNLDAMQPTAETTAAIHRVSHRKLRNLPLQIRERGLQNPPPLE